MSLPSVQSALALGYISWPALRLELQQLSLNPTIRSLTALYVLLFLFYCAHIHGILNQLIVPTALLSQGSVSERCLAGLWILSAVFVPALVLSSDTARSGNRKALTVVQVTWDQGGWLLLQIAVLWIQAVLWLVLVLPALIPAVERDGVPLVSLVGPIGQLGSFELLLVLSTVLVLRLISDPLLAALAAQLLALGLLLLLRTMLEVLGGGPAWILVVALCLAVLSGLVLYVKKTLLSLR